VCVGVELCAMYEYVYVFVVCVYVCLCVYRAASVEEWRTGGAEITEIELISNLFEKC
jgi:hypothetical protein